MESFKLHLLRLAREGRVEVPGVPVRGYTLVGEEEREDMAFYLVLEGELVIDLPQGQYLHLKRGGGRPGYGAPPPCAGGAGGASGGGVGPTRYTAPQGLYTLTTLLSRTRPSR